MNLTTGPNSDGVHPFADNGYIPGENQVAFLQSDNNLTTTLSQTLSGFKSGDQYKVSFFDNSRTYSQDPILSVLLGGKSIFTSTITPVESKGSYNVEYHTDSGIYTAGSSSTADLLFSSASTKDATVLIGGITIQDLGPVSAAPEPSQMGMLALVAAGLGALVVKARKRKTATLAA